MQEAGVKSETVNWSWESVLSEYVKVEVIRITSISSSDICVLPEIESVNWILVKLKN